MGVSKRMTPSIVKKLGQVSDNQNPCPSAFAKQKRDLRVGK